MKDCECAMHVGVCRIFREREGGGGGASSMCVRCEEKTENVFLCERESLSSLFSVAGV